MMEQSRENPYLLLMIGILVLPPLLIFGVRELFPANYLISSSYKLVFLLPIVFRVYWERKRFGDALFEGFSVSRFRENFWKVLGLGLGLAGIYLSAYLVARGFIDTEAIVAQLGEDAAINAGNVILIGIYIIGFNSLLEEFFWRGFMFKELRAAIQPWLAHVITGLAFSFHHVVFYYQWFDLGFMIVATLGLSGYAIIMNLVFRKYQDLFSCWLIHVCVDVVQIYIGLSIFGII